MSTFNNLTPRAQQVLSLAEKAAKDLNHSYIGTEHILLGLIKLGQGVACNALTKFVAPDELKREVLKQASALNSTVTPEESTWPGKIKAPQPWPDPPAARGDSTFRYYLLVDIGTQWSSRIVKTDPQATKQGDPAVAVVESHDLAKLDALYKPNAPAFLSNIYAREQFPGTVIIEGQSWGGWSLSPAEYNRIRRLIELAPQVEEFNRLAAYSV